MNREHINNNEHRNATHHPDTQLPNVAPIGSAVQSAARVSQRLYIPGRGVTSVEFSILILDEPLQTRAYWIQAIMRDTNNGSVHHGHVLRPRFK